MSRSASAKSRLTTAFVITGVLFLVAVLLWAFRTGKLGSEASVTVDEKTKVVSMNFDELSVSDPIAAQFTKLKDQYAQYGIRFTSQSYTAQNAVFQSDIPAIVLRLDLNNQPVSYSSPPNAVVGAAGDWPTLSNPIILTFLDPADPSKPSTTSSVEFHLGIKNFASSLNPNLPQGISQPSKGVNVTAYGVSGNQLSQRKYPAGGSQSVSIKMPGIAKVVVETADSLPYISNVRFALDDLVYVMPESSGSIDDQEAMTVTPINGVAPLTVTATYTNRYTSDGPPSTPATTAGQIGVGVKDGALGHGKVVIDGEEVRVPLKHFTKQANTPISLTAVADAGYRFDGWFTDGNCGDGMILPHYQINCVARFVGADVPDTNLTWDFGDGTTVNPGKVKETHTYEQSGTFVVVLTNDGREVGRQTVTVTAVHGSKDGQLTVAKPTYPPGEGVSFTLTNTGDTDITCSGGTPYIIQDSAGNTIFAPEADIELARTIKPQANATWTWDQKNTAGVQVPDGVYTVVVTCGNLRRSASFTIVSGDVPIASTLDFTVDPQQGIAPLLVTAAYVGSETGLVWDFGDGTVYPNAASTQQHTYPKAGVYTVTLRSGTKTGSKQVTVTAPPAADPPATPPDLSNTTPTGPSTTTLSNATKTSPAQLVSTGGNLLVNLGIATLISLIAGYTLLRRRPAA